MTTSATPTPPQERWRRLVVVVATVQVLTTGVTFPAFSVLVLPITEGLDISRPQLMAALTTSTLIGAVSAVPVGRWLDAHGGRTIMAGGSLLSVAGFLTWASAHSLPQLYLAFALVGLGLAFSAAETSTAVVVMATSPQTRDTAILVISTLTGLGTALYYPLTGWLAVELGWRMTLVVYAGALALVGSPLLAWAVPGREEHLRRRATRRGVSLGPALRSSNFWLLGSAFFVQAAANSSFALLMVTYFHEAGHPMKVAATLPVALGVLQVVARLLVMPLAPRLGMPALAVFSCVAQAVGMLMLPLAGLSIPLTLVCMGAIGLGFGLVMVARPALVAAEFGALQFGSILAAMTVLVSISRAGSPLVGSFLTDWRMVTLSGLLSLVAAALLVPVVVRQRRQGEYEQRGHVAAPVAA